MVNGENGLRVEEDRSEQAYRTAHHTTQITDFGHNYMAVEDPLLGAYPISGRPEDPLFIALNRTALGLRAHDITQLSKLEPHTTIPNTASFSRAGHVNNARQLALIISEREGLGYEQRLTNQLYAFLSDRSHGPLSHPTDLIFETWGALKHFMNSVCPKRLVRAEILMS